MLAYVLDHDDRIVEIEGDWDVFARENGAPELSTDRVLGQPIGSYVSGIEMQEITRLLFARPREQEKVALDFRCDSPAERRYLRMDLAALPRGCVRCMTTLLHREPRTPMALMDRGVLRNEELLVICSWCNKVRLPAGGWAEVEHAVELLGLFEEEPLPQLSHGICLACRDRVKGLA